MNCKGCIHNSVCGCMMLDCIRHPDNEKYAVQMQTNTFHDRFVDRTNPWNKPIDKRREL